MQLLRRWSCWRWKTSWGSQADQCLCMLITNKMCRIRKLKIIPIITKKSSCDRLFQSFLDFKVISEKQNTTIWLSCNGWVNLITDQQWINPDVQPGVRYMSTLPPGEDGRAAPNLNNSFLTPYSWESFFSLPKGMKSSSSLRLQSSPPLWTRH